MISSRFISDFYFKVHDLTMIQSKPPLLPPQSDYFINHVELLICDVRVFILLYDQLRLGFVFV
jgi:hypothetical protein